MTLLAELIRLWQARDDARDAWMASKGEEEVFNAYMNTTRALRGFIAQHRAAEVGAANMFWDDEDPEAACACPMEIVTSWGVETYGDIYKIQQAIRLPDIFAARVPGPDKDGRLLTAPTREELEKLIKEAGDA